MSQGDLYPVEITISNLYCFRGKHKLALEANVYAVLAQAEDNPQRSNWLGKSTLLMSFAFALFGWHTKRTDDEIITKGEEECKVELKLNDGTRMVRTKIRGKSMQITFYRNGSKVTQARAQEEIVQHIGFSKDDFFATYFYEQKKIGALVTAGAAERTAMVEGWLAEELEPAQRLHVAAVREHKARAANVATLEGRLLTQRTQFEELMVEYHGQVEDGVDMTAVLADQLKAAEAELVAAKASAKEVQADIARAKEWAAKRAQAEEFDELVEEGTSVREQFDALPEDAREILVAAEVATGKAVTAEGEALDRVRQLEQSTYQFDGQCPIACQACPSAAWVGQQATSPQALVTARKAATEATRAKQSAHQAMMQARQVVTQREALDRKLVQLRTRAEGLVDVADEVKAFDDALCDENPEAAEQAAEQAVDAAAEKVRQIASDVAWLEECIEGVTKLQISLKEARLEEQVAKEAVELTGRGGTGVQQAIQEMVLNKVELGANKLLSAASIPLQVMVRWAQETKGLAKVCPKCGTAFPTSQRVKSCGACGEQRGPNVQQKLGITLSDVSGAAEDLAGIALGIATSQWLRVQRGARWASVFIDEPFGALDAHNRQALGSHITSMLRSAYASAFVVAHERAILSAMPGRINIVATANGSRIG